jgi:uncharacterized protein (TIGR02466 family)
MKPEMQYELLQPWSTFVMKTKLPPSILEKMLKITDEIITNPETAEKWGHSLAGQIEQEFRIPHELLEREDVMEYFKDLILEFVITQHLQSYPEAREDILEEKWGIDMHTMWVISQKDNEYNPAHIHMGCHVSTVMYLKIPEYLPSRKSHRNDDGAINFTNNAGKHPIWGVPTMTIKPEVGDFFIFPSTQEHWVYPFRTPDGKGERRSVSFNAKFTRKSEYDALRKQQEEQEVI